MGSPEGYNFDTAREKDQSLSEIKTQAKEWEKNLQEEISQDMINKLYTQEWLEIKSGDTLSGINALTKAGNKIQWNAEGDNVHPGDQITIEDWKVFKKSSKNSSEKIEVWEVTQWYTPTPEKEKANTDITKIFKREEYSDEQIASISVKVQKSYPHLSVSNQWNLIWENGEYQIVWLILQNPENTDIEDISWLVFINNGEPEKINI